MLQLPGWRLHSCTMPIVSRGIRASTMSNRNSCRMRSRRHCRIVLWPSRFKQQEGLLSGALGDVCVQQPQGGTVAHNDGTCGYRNEGSGCISVMQLDQAGISGTAAGYLADNTSRRAHHCFHQGCSMQVKCAENQCPGRVVSPEGAQLTTKA